MGPQPYRTLIHPPRVGGVSNVNTQLTPYLDGTSEWTSAASIPMAASAQASIPTITPPYLNDRPVFRHANNTLAHPFTFQRRKV